MSLSNIQFKLTATLESATGQLHLLASEPTIDWDNLVPFSTWLIDILDARFISHDIGADLHRIAFEFEGTRLLLTLEEISASLWLELDNNDDIEVLAFISTLLNNR